MFGHNYLISILQRQPFLAVGHQGSLMVHFHFNRNGSLFMQHQRPVQAQMGGDGHNHKILQLGRQNRPPGGHRIGGGAGGGGHNQAVGRIGRHQIPVHAQMETQNAGLFAAPDDDVI